MFPWIICIFKKTSQTYAHKLLFFSFLGTQAKLLKIIASKLCWKRLSLPCTDRTHPQSLCQGNLGKTLKDRLLPPQYSPETVSFFCGLHPTLNILLLSSIRMLQVIVKTLVWKVPFHRAFYVAHDV